MRLGKRRFLRCKSYTPKGTTPLRTPSRTVYATALRTRFGCLCFFGSGGRRIDSGNNRGVLVSLGNRTAVLDPCLALSPIETAHSGINTRTSRLYPRRFLLKNHSVIVARAHPVPRCLRRRLEPSVRGREEALVCVDTGAAADLAGHVQGVPKYADLARAGK